MGQILGLWAASIVLAHVLGLVLLLYALEKVSGALSRPARRARAALSGAPLVRRASTDDAAAAVGKKGAAARAARRASLAATTLGDGDDAPLSGAPATPRSLPPRWTRACACKVGLVGGRGVGGRPLPTPRRAAAAPASPARVPAAKRARIGARPPPRGRAPIYGGRRRAAEGRSRAGGGRAGRAHGPWPRRALSLRPSPPPHPPPPPLQDTCFCEQRWSPPQGLKAPGDLAVPYPADLSWRALSCTVTDRTTLLPKCILAPCAGAVVPGEMCAIVGPSGAGKSTLLELLAGQRPVGAVGGAIWMNGRPVGKRFRRVSAFVNQSDMFVPTMSAAETLRFHARLRVPPGSGDREARLQAVLETMGLWRSRGTQVGGTLPGGLTVRGLSGGEKRRLTIACSLIARPSILFLDEPTSGLDSFAALNIMDYVSKLAGLGHTVVASVHQPRAAIWDMFHKVCVLSEGAQLFCGAPAGAAPWFGSLGYRHSPRRDGAVSDWIIDLVSVGFSKPPGWAARSMTSTEDVLAAADKWASRPPPPPADGADGTLLAAMDKAAADAEAAADGRSPAKPRPVSALPTAPTAPDRAAPPRAPRPSGLAGLFAPRDARFAKYPTSWWTQFTVLVHRAWTQQVRNPADATSRLMLAVWISAAAGMIAFNTKLGPSTAGRFVGSNFFEIIVFSLLPFCYMSLYANDRAFFVSDVRSGLYRPSAYHAALTVASLPFIILFSVLGGFVTYGMVGLRPEWKAIVLFGVLMCLVSMCAIQLLVYFTYSSATQVGREERDGGARARGAPVSLVLCTHPPPSPLPSLPGHGLHARGRLHDARHPAHGLLDPHPPHPRQAAPVAVAHFLPPLGPARLFLQRARGAALLLPARVRGVARAARVRAVQRRRRGRGRVRSGQDALAHGQGQQPV